MKNLTGQFTKYTVILLIVGAILVLIGGLSVGRKAIANQREIALDMSAKTRVDLISKENVQLKSENKQLKTENEKLAAETTTAVSEKTAAEKKAQSLEAFLYTKKYIEENNAVKAKEKFAVIDKAHLPDVFKEEYEKIEEILNAE